MFFVGSFKTRDGNNYKVWCFAKPAGSAEKKCGLEFAGEKCLINKCLNKSSGLASLPWLPSVFLRQVAVRCVSYSWQCVVCSALDSGKAGGIKGPLRVIYLIPLSGTVV